MLLQNVILSFPSLFQPKAPKGSNTPRYDAQFLISPNHPQLAQVQQLFNEQVAIGYPSGLPRSVDVCFGKYSDMIDPNKEYYRQEMADWYILKTTRKVEQGKPTTVDTNYNDQLDPSKFFSGALVHVHFDIAYYAKGKTGIGGFLNGVMTTGEEGQLGRLDGRPTTEQMFSGIGKPAAPAPAPPAPNMAPVAPPTPPARQMTAAANGCSYEQMIAAGWTDETLIANGMMLPPGGAPLKFM